MKSIKKYLFLILLTNFFLSENAYSQSFNLQAIIDAMIQEATGNLERDIKYKEAMLQNFAKSYEGGKTYNFEENAVGAVNAIRALNKTLIDLGLPAIDSGKLKVPAYVYKAMKKAGSGNSVGVGDVELLDLQPVSIGQRCTELNPINCYGDAPENVDTDRVLDTPIGY